MDKLKLGALLKGLAKIIGSRPRLPRSLESNEALRTILERRSVRHYSDAPLPADAWAAILEAGRVAPSTVNLQTWSFALFDRDEWSEFFGKALPLGGQRAIIVLADLHRAKRVVEGFPYAPLAEYTVGVMNASLAAMNMVQAAETLGVSSVMLSETGRTGFYDAAFLAEQLALPPGVVPITTIVFGYSARGEQAMPPKLPPGAVTFTGRYRETPADILADWHLQMRAGYQAGHKGEDFSAKIRYYNTRIRTAERDLRRLVFYDGE
ncbi:MAG: hypothetical protein GY835_12335 [bacterium]|nr:hypothetical protein [bacterium]